MPCVAIRRKPSYLSRSVSALGVTLFTVLTLPALADENSFRFSLEGSAAVMDSKSGKGDYYSLSAKAYLDPIKLDASLPYEVAPFYKRISNVFIGALKGEYTGLRLVRGGSILNSSDFQSETLGLKLADNDSPLWGEFYYTRIGKSNYEFSDGSSDTSEARDAYQITAGWFINQELSVYGFYGDDDATAYGAGMRGLLRLDTRGVIEGSLQYWQSEYETEHSALINNQVRNLDNIDYKTTAWSYYLSYYPQAQTALTFAHRYFNHGDDDTKSEHLSIAISHFVTDQLRLAASYLDVSHEKNGSVSGRFDHDITKVSLSYRL